ncbi:hypothetical protein [Candidatus Amarolinea dominans]|uniref:hypothetical protein n=1 Tax=Candidatus Amarolinea dominans TaxID=3140696 RepID=UPI0031CCA8E4
MTETGAMETRVLTRKGETRVIVSLVGVSPARLVSAARFSCADFLPEGARM